MKTCKICGVSKPTEDFYKNPLGPQGLSSSCILCSREYGRVRSKLMKPWKKPEYQTKRRSRMRNWHLRSLYNISLKDFEELVARQGGLCACCRRPMPRPHVDHDHKTGKIRGVLCGTCNTGLGQFGDEPLRCDQAAAYLRQHSL